MGLNPALAQSIVTIQSKFYFIIAINNNTVVALYYTCRIITKLQVQYIQFKCPLIETHSCIFSENFKNKAHFVANKFVERVFVWKIQV